MRTRYGDTSIHTARTSTLRSRNGRGPNRYSIIPSLHPTDYDDVDAVGSVNPAGRFHAAKRSGVHGLSNREQCPQPMDSLDREQRLQSRRADLSDKGCGTMIRNDRIPFGVKTCRIDTMRQ